MTPRADAEYARWLRLNATSTLLIYSGLIAVLLPAFHFVLRALPGVPPGSDSLPLRCVSAGLSAAIAIAVVAFPALRRYALTLQFFNVLACVVVIVMLVVNSGNHYAYVASGLLAIVGAQQAFYRTSHLAATFAIGFCAHVGYAAAHGILWDPMNLAALGTVGSGYLVGFIPAALRIKIQTADIRNRLAAQQVKEELLDAQTALMQLARYDALTGLPNRTTVQELLAEEIASAERTEARCAVAFVDLDRFKDVNDTLGHEVGDRVLRELSARVSKVIGAAGVLARWGGDEFVVIVPSALDDEIIELLARSFIHTIAEPFSVDGIELAISASVGIAVYPRDGAEPSVLIRNADTAMYKAKHDMGSGVAFFSDELHAIAANRHYVQNELRRAITDGGLELYYQPIVEARSGHVVAAEALVRWTDHDGRLHLPSDFMAIAEDSRIIVPLGAWVLNAACERAARWRREGRGIGVAVNVSPRQFAHPDFVETLARALRGSGASPEDVEIEITEAAIMSNVDPVLATLQAVHRMGIRVAIDDFGTGYSSFAYLKRFEVDSLKIDRTFVEGIERDDNLAIARSIISVAHALGLPVTAEGVETPLQARILAELGCDRLQGYYFGRPITAGAFDVTLERDAAATVGVPSVVCS
ncbi:MAG TPA: EAL domain-containing protein [Candidatus Elarobacter sp.]